MTLPRCAAGRRCGTRERAYAIRSAREGDLVPVPRMAAAFGSRCCSSWLVARSSTMATAINPRPDDCAGGTVVSAQQR